MIVIIIYIANIKEKLKYSGKYYKYKNSNEFIINSYFGINILYTIFYSSNNFIVYSNITINKLIA
jgi:hypothetical protein